MGAFLLHKSLVAPILSGKRDVLLSGLVWEQTGRHSPKALSNSQTEGRCPPEGVPGNLSPDATDLADSACAERGSRAPRPE